MLKIHQSTVACAASVSQGAVVLLKRKSASISQGDAVQHKRSQLWFASTELH
jgi:hypothetical protein